MRGIRSKVAVAVLAVGATAGLSLVGASPAFAGDASGSFTDLYCSTGTYHSSGAPYIDCSVGSYFYLHHERVAQTTAPKSVNVGTNIPCTFGGVSNFYGYTDLRFTPSSAPNAKYKVTITSCGGSKDVYRVDNDGDVSFISGTG